MKTLKIKIVDWWDEKPKQNYFIKFLSKFYDIEFNENPDYLLCSVFGHQHFGYDCVKILFIGENINPDFNLYDYALGFSHITFQDRYLRYPLYLLYENALIGASTKHLDINANKLLKRNFCSFVVSNGASIDNVREHFFDLLLQKYPIASGGKYRNNIGGPIKNKLDFIKSYKFNIAFENSSTNGYCTEKLIEALSVQTLPIYYGDPMLLSKIPPPHTYINPKSFINIGNFSSFDEAISYIEEIHHHPKLYLQYLKEPAFTIESIKEFYQDLLKKFFYHIFSQDLQVARRIPKSQRNFYYTKKLSKTLKK